LTDAGAVGKLGQDMVDARRTLLLAAGGGGDALAAMMLADAAGMGPGRFAVASFAWERTMFDPRPGPRPAAHFVGLRKAGRFNWEITPGSRLRDPYAESFLPRLAAEKHGPLLLLDGERGVRGIHRQLGEIVSRMEVDRILIVDVGGDLLARGSEATLTSPTADAMILAAAAELRVPAQAVVVGMGLDGENITNLGPDSPSPLPNDLFGLPDSLPAETARRFSASFAWSPSEATGLAYMVARGWRGTAEIRAGGQHVHLHAASSRIHLFNATEILARSRLAREIAGTISLEQVESIVQAHGLLPEREIERSARMSERRSVPSEGLPRLEAQLLRYSEIAAARSVDYLTIRRIGELLRVDALTLHALVTRLRERHPYRLRPPTWNVHER
jgi:hypothetical protein